MPQNGLTSYIESLLVAVVAIISLLMPVASPAAKAKPTPYLFTQVDAVFDSIARQVLTNEFNRVPAARNVENIVQLSRIASRSGDPVLKARASLWKIRANQINATPDSCITTLERLRSALPAEYDYDRACLTYQLAGNHDRIGNYFVTYQLLQEAIPVFEKYGDDYFLGNAHLLMGLNYFNISEPDLAIEEIRLADSNYRKAGYPSNRSHYFEATFAKDEKAQLRLFRKSIAEGADDPGMTVQAYDKMATIFNSMNLPDSALRYVSAGKKMIAEMLPDNFLLKIILDLKEAQTMLIKGEVDASLALLKKAEGNSERFRNEYWETDLYKLLSAAYEAKGNSTLAFLYLKKHLNATERDIATLRAAEIPKARAREAINRQKTQIARMEQDARNAKSHFFIILLALVVVLLAAGGVVIYILQRSKLRKIENRELRSNLEQEMIIKRLNLENFERDIKRKDCEISSSVLLLSNKNDVLQQIGELTRQYSDDRRIPDEYVRQVNSMISDSLRGDDEWSRFKVHFDSVHPNFFTKLKAASEELTENDLRLCAYLRIGMRAKDIASMLSVSPASVNTNRYRIRKKLGLTKEDSLDDYIRSI